MLHPNIHNEILLALLQSPDQFVSGSALAEEAGVSRVSIWSHFDQLKEEGFEFEAIRNRGYKLLKTPTHVHGELITAYLKLFKAKIPLHFSIITDSTQSEAERQLAAGSPTPFAVISRTMTAGRGRHGRTWLCDNTGNIYLTMAFQPNLPPAKMQLFGLWMGAHICELLNQEYDLPVLLKWPNDLMLNGKKICGMLAEARIDMNHTRDIVFGIGINVNDDCQNWPSELKTKATSLSKESAKFFNINKLAAQVIATVIEAYPKFTDENYATEMHTLWTKYDFLKNQDITAYTGNATISGRAVGIDSEGYLLLKTNNSKLERLNVAEVSLSGHIGSI